MYLNITTYYITESFNDKNVISDMFKKVILIITIIKMNRKYCIIVIHTYDKHKIINIFFKNVQVSTLNSVYQIYILIK